LGRVAVAGPPGEVRADPKALMAYLGESDEAIMASGPVHQDSAAPGDQ